MSEQLTKLTEIVTALGTLGSDLPAALRAMPAALTNVPSTVWAQVISLHEAGEHAVPFETAFANGVALLDSGDGLRGRRPRLVEWKGPHRHPGDDVIPADLRIDHVYLVSCKYLSKVLLNPGPARLFNSLLVGEDRIMANWFHETAPTAFQAFYEAAAQFAGVASFPRAVRDLTTAQQRQLRSALPPRKLPPELLPAWTELCAKVSVESVGRWRAALKSERSKLRLLWRLLRISNATYFVLGTDGAAHLRLRVASTWDWNQAFALKAFTVTSGVRGQAEVGWNAEVHERGTGDIHEIRGHVEVRWSHGRFVGSPEAKVYLDTPLASVPGYYTLV